MDDKTRNLAITTCILAGQILIENGSNMDRVNDTVYRMGRAAGLKSFQVFTTVTGMVASSDHLPNAQAVDIRVRKNNLRKVAEVNDVSRRFVKGKLTLTQTYAELSAIDRDQTNLPEWLQCVAAAVLSGALLVIFTGDYGDVIESSLIGGIGYWVFLVLFRKFQIKYISEFSAAVVVGVSAMLLQKVGIVANANATIIGSIMPLVPGIPLTNAARDFVAGNLISGPSRALEALLTAAAIASAIVLVLRYVA